MRTSECSEGIIPKSGCYYVGSTLGAWLRLRAVDGLHGSNPFRERRLHLNVNLSTGQKSASGKSAFAVPRQDAAVTEKVKSRVEANFLEGLAGRWRS
jgi:hypothetical protein